VDFFSKQWTVSETSGEAQHFDNRYRELFDRKDKNPYNYRIKPALFESVVRILSDLPAPSPSQDKEAQPSASQGSAAGTTVPRVNGPAGETDQELSNLAEQLDGDGVFDPASLEDARIRTLQAVVVREGQPRFRAALLDAYGGRCAITARDAARALETAHVKPYEGVLTNVVVNGILLRADIHTLFDLDLIGIEPSGQIVRISSQLANTVYQEFEGTPLRRPTDPSAIVNTAALAWRWERF
jgi:hypothetical protein